MYTFMGANVRDASISLGWGLNETSRLNVVVVDDGTNNFTGTTSQIGTPVTFTAGSCTFAGLLSSFGQSKNVRGGIQWDVQVTDPRIILSGAEVITGGFSGDTEGMKNLYNVFAYYESVDFGSSFANETGMLWSLVLAALTDLIDGTQGSYGGPLHYRGYDYDIDLSELPTPPADYRVGGQGSINLLELIDQVCTDGGYDFYITLVGSTITVKTVSRATAPPLGTIATFITAQEGNDLVSSQAGVELRNEEMSRFLVGGEQRELYLTGSITSYWGNDADGNPILGQATSGILIDRNTTGVIFMEPMDVMSLNASPVADILGSTTYLSNTIELRAALYSYSAWSQFMQNHKSGIADIIGIYSEYSERGNRPPAFQGGPIPPQIVNDSPTNSALALSIEANDAQRFYEFVRGYATEFHGKKWAIEVPQVDYKVDPDTLITTYTYEPTDGAFLPDGSQPLGLAPLNEDVFRQQDGRYTPFVRFSNLGTGVDFTRFNPSDTVLQATEFIASGVVSTMFSKASCDNQIYFYGATPLVVFELPAVLVNKQNSIVGGYEWAIAAMQAAPPIDITDGIRTALEQPDAFIGFTVATALIGAQQVANVRNRLSYGSVPAFYLAPDIIKPTYAAVPLKSNIYTYGPWYAQGPQGAKIRFEQDTSLVPWNYGGFTEMNLAANAKLSAANTNAQIIESGHIEQEGLPSANIGGVLSANGPNITSININFRIDGVTTTYRFQSFTPNRLGTFNRQNADKIRRIGTIAQNLRRETRIRANELQLRNQIRSDARQAYLANASHVQRRESPHPVITSEVMVDPSGHSRLGMAVMTNEESVIAARPGENYSNTAVMSLGGLFAPGATQSTSLIPQITLPSGESILDSNSLNLFQAWSHTASKPVEFLTTASSYEGLYTYSNEVSANIAQGEPQRFIALRGPLQIAGWGYTIGGSLTNSGLNYHQDISNFKVGPVDHLWDYNRGVWTSHSMLRAQIQDNLGLGGSVTAYILDSNSSPNPDFGITAHGLYDRVISSGETILLGFDPYSARWYGIPVGSGSNQGYSFESEFGVTTSGNSNIVSANWGTGIQPINDYNHEGSGEFFARADHIHYHGVFDSGNYHPEYNLAVREVDGSPSGYPVRDLAFNSADGFSLSINNYTTIVSLDDFVGSGPTAKHGLVPQPPSSADNQRFLCENGTWAIVPTGIYVQEVDGNPIVSPVLNLSFDQDDAFSVTYSNYVARIDLAEMIGSGPTAKRGLVPTPPVSAGTAKFLREDGTWQVAATGTSINAGYQHSVLYTDEFYQVYWHTYPILFGLQVGGYGLIGTGVLSLGTQQNSGVFNLMADTRKTDFNLILPSGNPVSGDVLQVYKVNNNIAHTQWTPLPSGLGGGGLNGAGTTNTIAKWISPNTLGNSNITDDGSTITVNSPSFEVISTSNVTINFATTFSSSGNNFNFFANEDYKLEVDGDATITVAGDLLLRSNNNILLEGGSTSSVSLDGGTMAIGGSSSNLGFFGNSGNTKQTVTGNLSSDVAGALRSLLDALAAYNLITDSTTGP